MEAQDTNPEIRRMDSAFSATKTIQINEHVTILPQTQTNRKRRWLTTSAPATFDKVAVVAALLGVLIGVGFAVMPSLPSMGMYMVALGMFHLLEFVVTARYNHRTLGMCSFLLTNGLGYAGAQLAVVVEYTIRWSYCSHTPSRSPCVFVIGGVALILGQIVRTSAMIQAAQSFNHYVQETKRQDHTLVTTGIYAYVRHPSYFGYYLWMVASQVVLGNTFSLILFALIINYYFVKRLQVEEAALIKFFGDDYQEYRRRVWSGIPFYR